MRKMNSDKSDKVDQRQESTENVREAILSAALVEFSLHGLEGARVDQIAQRAGVNKAMIYYYFRSKEKLYEDLFHDHFQRVAAQLKLSVAPETELGDALLRIAETHINMARQRPEIIPVFLRELANPRHEFLDLMAGYFRQTGLGETMRQKFEAEIQRKGFRDVDLRQSIISFITMSMGYLIMAPWIDRVFSVTDRDAFLEQRKLAIVDLFLNGVKAKKV
jgi:TetR/AcrR family transcriptional regulator